MVLFSYLIVFRVMGRNYDAAVMTAGFIGFSMGATSNAMANMQVVTKKYGPSPVAYFAIPHGGRNVHRLLQRGAHHLQHRALGPLTQGSGYIPPVSSR